MLWRRYSALAGYATTQLRVDASPNATWQLLSVNGVPLLPRGAPQPQPVLVNVSGGGVLLAVTVTAQSNATATYTVNVTLQAPPSGDASLSALLLVPTPTGRNLGSGARGQSEATILSGIAGTPESERGAEYRFLVHRVPKSAFSKGKGLLKCLLESIRDRTEFGLRAGNTLEPGEETRNRAYLHPRASDLP